MPRHHRSSSSPLLSPPVLIILLPTVILLFLIYAIPPLISLTSHILQPTVSVKKSWDSLNVFLVIFAILCGVFARKHDDAGEGLPDPDHHHVHIHNASDPLLDRSHRTTSSPQSESSVFHVPQQQWFGYSEKTSRMYDTTPVKTPENVSGGGRLRRRSSYPDMRQVESLWETLDDVQTKSQFRFFDDFEISNYKTHRHNKETTSDDVKEIKVDTFVLQPSLTPPPKSPTPPPPPPPPPRREKQRTYETVGHRSKEKVEEVKFEEVRSTPSPTPPPPPPPRRTPPSPMRVRSDQKHGRLERRKSNVKKEIAMVWNSVLSNQRKRKRKQKATRNIYDTAATMEPLPEQSQPPPPPPPPPPSSVFHNLFKKGSKTKKVHSVPTAAPLPPPPPPSAAVSVRTHQTRSRSTLPPPAPPTPPRPPPSAHSRRRPPLPTKPSTSYEVDNVNSGCQSPLIPIPPPPPPFKMPAMKFFVKGDFVKIRSAQNSRSASPEPEEVVADPALPAGKEESTSTSTVNVTDGGDGAGRASPSVFCPSPDVNTKADNFIARLRDEWRLEKINSLREKKMN